MIYNNSRNIYRKTNLEQTITVSLPYKNDDVNE